MPKKTLPKVPTNKEGELRGLMDDIAVLVERATGGKVVSLFVDADIEPVDEFYTLGKECPNLYKRRHVHVKDEHKWYPGVELWEENRDDGVLRWLTITSFCYDKWWIKPK